MGNTVTILLPHGEIGSLSTKLAPRPLSLVGRRIGFIDNELWQSMHILCDELAKVFTSEYGVEGTETIYINPMAATVLKDYQDQMERFSRRVDAVVSGLGN